MKWLAKVGMFFHPHKEFEDESLDPDRVVMVCQTCGQYWSWDKK